MATLTGHINRYIRSYEMLRQPYVLDWEDGDYIDPYYEVESSSFEVEVPDGYRLLTTQSGETALFAPGDDTRGMTLAEAIVVGVARVEGPIVSSDGRPFVATHLARG